MHNHINPQNNNHSRPEERPPLPSQRHARAEYIAGRLISSFGLRVATNTISQITAACLRAPFTTEQAGCGPSAEVADILFARHFLKTLCATALREDIQHLTRNLAAPEFIVRQRHSAAQRMLSPTGEDADPGAYFDPRSWPVSEIHAADDTSRLHRLVLIVEAMLDQEQGLRDAGATPLEAAQRAVLERQS